jgi:uncharacterized BrkB/YihY/UPF0761 family membrane protein
MPTPRSRPLQPSSMKRTRLRSLYADYAGIVAAVVCLIHCLAAPLVLGAAAHGHSHSHDHAHAADVWYLHRGWDFVFLAVGLFAVWYSSQHSQQRWMNRLLWGSFGFLALSVLLEASGSFFRYLVYLSSLILVVAHLLQLRRAACARKPSGYSEARSLHRQQAETV